MAARFSDQQLDDAGALASANDRVRDEALALADDDGRAYAGVLDAMRADHTSDEARRSAIAAALDEACQVPVVLIEHATRVGALALRLARDGNPNLRADALTGLHLAVAAARSSLGIVRENTELGDLDRDRLRDLAEQVATVERLAVDVDEPVVDP